LQVLASGGRGYFSGTRPASQQIMQQKIKIREKNLAQLSFEMTLLVKMLMYAPNIIDDWVLEPRNPEMHAFCVNIILNTSNATEDDCSVATLDWNII
jgi:hypothetical protein